MSGESYLYEKLLSAVGSMATSPSSLQDRLHTAALTCIAVKERELSDDVRPRWQEIMRRLTAVPPRSHEGSLDATLSQMTNEEAHAVAELIWDLFCELGDVATARLPTGRGSD